MIASSDLTLFGLLHFIYQVYISALTVAHKFVDFLIELLEVVSDV